MVTVVHRWAELRASYRQAVTAAGAGARAALDAETYLEALAESHEDGAGPLRAESRELAVAGSVPD